MLYQVVFRLVFITREENTEKLPCLGGTKSFDLPRRRESTTGVASEIDSHLSCASSVTLVSCISFDP